MIINKVEKYINQHNLCNSGTPILLACSGGVDSMVLLDIFLKLKYNFAVVHCNFKLRGEESDMDMQFVIDYCKHHGISYFIREFDTLEYKKKHKISTQIAARNLRYEWFEELRKEQEFHFIATAHHAEDQLETILINLTKGTGLHGLIGMKPKHNFVIRPMLSIAKHEILEYAHEHQIKHREDSSNSSVDYLRNKIRHQVSPILKEINPNVTKNIEEFSGYMSDVAHLLEMQINIIKKKCWIEKNNIIYIRINYIRQYSSKNTILFYLLKDFGFSNDVLQNILHHSATSAQFFSETHRMILDRNQLIITPIHQEKVDTLLFDKIPNQIQFNSIKIKCSIVPIQLLNLKENKNYAYIDADKIQFPLVIRYLKNGDYFYPFGMSKPKNKDKVGKKKISKYFRDLKLDLLQKENTPIIFSNERALWLVGCSIDDRFKITSETVNVLKMKLIL